MQKDVLKLRRNKCSEAATCSEQRSKNTFPVKERKNSTNVITGKHVCLPADMTCCFDAGEGLIDAANVSDSCPI